MNSERLKILAINSLPANGNAGLKMVMSVLGTYAIPVPTLVLSGTGNMRGYTRYPLPFEDLLVSTLQLAKDNGQSLILYVGYLSDDQQASIIAQQLTRFSDIIRFVLIDPVCGDNGRAYVPDALIDSWEQLLIRADIALPNITEVALLTGIRQAISLNESDAYLATFQQKYPRLECIVTGLVEGNQVVNQWIKGNQVMRFVQPYYPTYFSGTGDTFASLFLWLRFLKNLPTEQAIREAGINMTQLVQYAIRAESTELLISADANRLFSVSPYV